MTDSSDSAKRSQHRIVGDQLAYPCREVLRLGVPTFSPASRSSARTPFSTSRRLLSTIRRAVSSARQERQDGLFTCTARYQPVRMICAIPRASLRSVLFGIAPIAAFAWRASMQIAGIPASVSP